MNTVAVKRELIIWARERSGLAVDAFVKKFPKFITWESGEAQPTFRQLENLAKKTHTPLGYFFLSEPPQDRLPIPDLRVTGNQKAFRPSPNLLETVQSMQRRQNWMRDFLMEEGEDPLAFVGSANLLSPVVEVAANIRKVLGLGINWATEYSSWTDARRGLRDAIERRGILVAINGIVGNNTHRKLDKEEFQGFVLKDEYAPLIFINGVDFKAAQMFSLAHELAHLWLGQSGVFNLRALQPVDNEVEKFCDRVAAEFLVPEKEFRAVWNEAAQSEEPFQFLARRYKVSTLVIARRALDMNFISRNRFFEFYNEYHEYEPPKKGEKSKGDFYKTQSARIGKRFAYAVIRAAKEGRLLYRDAYSLTGLHGKTFDKYASSLGSR